MLKRLTMAFGLFVFALLTFLVLAAVLIDPRDFEVDLTAWFSQQTGRRVHVLGSLDYEFFPWLGLRVTDLAVEQPKGFGKEPFLTVDEVRLRVRLLPLVLRQELELGRIEVLGPRFELRQTREGFNNWDDVLQRLFPDAASESSSPPELKVQGGTLPVRPLTWQGLELHQGSVIFHDELADDVIEIDNLELVAAGGKKFDYRSSCSVSSRQLTAVAELSMFGRCIVQTAPLNLLLQNAELNVELEALVAGYIRHGGFSGIADVDLGARTLELKQATLRLAGMRIGGALMAQNLFHEDVFIQGELSLLECSPETLLGGDESSQTFCDYLENVAASTGFTATSQALNLHELQLVLPGVDAGGSVTAQLSPELSVSAQLAGNSLDFDHFLSNRAPSPPTALPPWLVSWPKTFPPLHLECTFSRFSGGNLRLNNVTLQASAGPEGLQISLDKAGFMEGAVSASGKSRDGEFYLSAELLQADANALSTLLFNAPHVQGRLSLQADASSKGPSLEDIWSNLRLKADLQLSQSALDFTSPPKLLGARPQPEFRFDGCTASLALSAAEQQPASRQAYAYTLDSRFTNLHPAGLFGPAIRGKKYTELVNGTFNLAGTALMDLDSGEFLGLENTAVSLDYAGPGIHIWPAQHWDFKGHGTGRLDMARDLLAISEINASLPALPIKGNLTIENAFKPGSPSRYTGAFQAADFIPRQILPLFAIAPPETRSMGALRRGSVDATYAITNRAMDIEVLQLQVDDTAASGTIALEGLDRQGPLMHRFELVADRLKLDDYLPPEEEQGGKEGSWSSEWLQDLRLSGGVSIGELRLLDLRHDSLRATVEADNGALRLKPVSSRFYDGEFFGVLGLHTLPRNEGLGVSLECSVADFQLENVIRDLGGGNVVGGLASWDMNVAGGGDSKRRLLQTLSGKARFRVKDGFYLFESKNAGRSRKASAGSMPGAKRDKEDKTPGQTRMEFSKGEATFIVQDGQVRNDDFHVQGLIMQAHGSGKASLPAKTLDYTLLVQMTGAPTIPIHIHGPFANPEVNFTQSQMLTDTMGRLGGSVFGVFKTILTLPFTAVEALQNK